MITREFRGMSARVAKRRALQYWYQNRDTLGLSMTEFFGRCRLCSSGDSTRITFYAHGR